jgi:hypothetical protein
MIATLVGLTVGAIVNWSAKFVPYDEEMSHLSVLDCRRDLSLVGYEYSQFVDASPCRPTAIIHGHVAEIEREKNSKLWGFSITKKGYVAALSDYPVFNNKNRIKNWNPKVVSISFPGLQISKSSVRVPKESGFASGLYPAKIESFSTLPSNLKSELKRRNQELYDPGVTVHWMGLKSDVRLGNANYQPVSSSNPTMRLDDSGVTIAVVKIRGAVQPLSTAVSNSNELTFDDIVWRSDEDWFVCRGSRRGVSGLIWLYPKR